MGTHHFVVAVSGANVTNSGACGKGEFYGLTRRFTLGVLIRRRFFFLSRGKRSSVGARHLVRFFPSDYLSLSLDEDP